jgi:aspartate kinase
VIVMKFGGTSVADASRIRAVAEIVAARLSRRPVVVVSALAGVTDLLVRAVAAARAGDREAQEPALSDLERRHRWAVAGIADAPRARHDLSLEVDARFEELRQLLRSLRLLGEGTPRSTDTVLAYGEDLASRIVTAAFLDRGLPARLVDARAVMRTDARHGAAEPDLAAVERAAATHLRPLLAAGEVPVVGGFVGSGPDGRTTTLGRGGSDLSASVLGSALAVEEIQIWTDVDGILSADPRLVPGARTLPSVSFGEAAELAFYGAKVLHPASIAPAVVRDIPVRVLNTLRPEGEGTVVVRAPGPEAPALASVASRAGICTARVLGRRMRVDPGFLPRVLQAFESAGLVPDLVVSSEVGLTAVVPDDERIDAVAAGLAGEAQVELARGRGVLCVVGAGLSARGEVRERVLRALGELSPEIVALGGSGSSAAAVVPEGSLGEAVRQLHRRFFEEVPV